MKYFQLILFFFLLIPFSYSQNITIKGKADASHIGKEVVLSDYLDYITYTRVKESIDTVDKDGYFELKLQASYTHPVLISIGNLTGKIYVQPNYVYGISFPGKDSLNNNQEGTETIVDISVFGKDSMETNAMIIDFNTRYNDLFSKSTDAYLSPAKINLMLDTFFVRSKRRYAQIKNPYFKKYVVYTFAGFYSNISRSKTLLYKEFLENKPILYHNYEYMEFFNSHFKGYLKAFASTKTGGNIYNSINAYGDYNDLKNRFIEDKSITNDTLRELLILKGLIDFYYSPDFDKKQVQSVIEQLQRDSNYPENKKIAFNMLQNTYQLQNGANAPDFTAYDKQDGKVNLSSYKGKYIYLNFFSTQSDNSLKEMQKIIDLKKKFNDKVTFVSVCLDDSIKTYKAYLKANVKQNWLILYQGNGNAKQNYAIKTLSGYFFINQQFILAQSPALAPSEGMEYKLNGLFKPKRKNTIIGIR